MISGSDNALASALMVMGRAIVSSKYREQFNNGMENLVQ